MLVKFHTTTHSTVELGEDKHPVSIEVSPDRIKFNFGDGDFAEYYRLHWGWNLLDTTLYPPPVKDFLTFEVEAL